MCTALRIVPVRARIPRGKKSFFPEKRKEGDDTNVSQRFFPLPFYRGCCRVIARHFRSDLALSLMALPIFDSGNERPFVRCCGSACFGKFFIAMRMFRFHFGGETSSFELLIPPAPYCMDLGGAGNPHMASKGGKVAGVNDLFLPEQQCTIFFAPPAVSIKSMGSSPR